MNATGHIMEVRTPRSTADAYRTMMASSNRFPAIPAAPKSLDAHAVPQHHPTSIQITLLIIYIAVFVVWVVRLCHSLFKIRLNNSQSTQGFGLIRQDSGNKRSGQSHSSVSVDVNNDNRFHPKSDGFHYTDNTDVENGRQNSTEIHAKNLEGSAVITIGQNGFTENLNERHSASTSPVHQNENNESTKTVTSLKDHEVKATEPIKSPAPSSGPPPVTLDKFLQSAVMFGAIMMYFFFCDYWKILPQGKREYSRDIFLFLVFLFFLVASAFTIKDNQDKVLNRDQTEEWKGWMQVMFVWYHYFKAKEWYNWIRVYIACYVWMTGFGNFSFFWIRKDFSMWRMIKMLFRLNFLVIFVAMVTNNEYMLYYICAMHTYWFFTVYVFMRVLNSWNTDRFKMAAKFGAYALCNFIIFDIPGVSQNFFRPLQFILGLHDNKGDVMHEWSFRAGLDHWACFLGILESKMLCAYNYPHFEALMAYLDSQSSSRNDQMKKLGIRIGLGAGAVLTGIVWYFTFMTKEKYAYNALHPYTSAFPILIFIVLRNIHPCIRVKHLGMFSWLGKITLETYLSQLHIYLLSNARALVVFIPNYPLLNFSLATIIYLAMSHTLFNITTDVSNFLIPRNRKRMFINFAAVGALFGVSGFVAIGVML